MRAVRWMDAAIRGVVFVLLVAACGDPAELSAAGDPRQPHEPEPAGSALVPAFVPGGLKVSQVDPADERYPGMVTRVYAGGDRSLAVAYVSGSETSPQLPSRYDDEEVSGEADGVRWLSRLVKSENQEPPQVAVVGRGIDGETIRSISRGLRTDEESSDASPSELPAGMREVAAARVSLADLASPYGFAFSGARILWTGPEASMQLLAARHDPELSTVLKAAVDSDDDVDIRGQKGRAGKVVVPDPSAEMTMWTWTERDLDIVLTAHGISNDEVARVVDSLEPATSEDWERLSDQASEPPPDAENELSVSAAFDGGFWRYTLNQLEADDGSILFGDMVTTEFANGDFGGGGGGGVHVDEPRAAFSASRAGVLAHGYVPSATSRVEVESEGGAVTDALLRKGDGWPIAPYGVLLPPGAVVTRVTAYLPDGSRYELRERIQVGEGSGLGGRALPLVPPSG